MKQIADEIQVSKQAVWQRIKRSEELLSMFENHSETINGRIHVDELFEQHIKKFYSNRQHVDGNVYGSSTCIDSKAPNVDVNVDGVDGNVYGSSTCIDSKAPNVDVNALMATLQRTVDILQHQLTVKDNQITELTSMLKASKEQQATLVTALSAAQALHAGTIKERLTDRFEDTENQEDSIVDMAPEDKNKPQKLKNFFAKIFGRN